MAQIGADPIEPDSDRLILPLAETLFIALPGQVSFETENIDDINISVPAPSTQSAVENRYRAVNIRAKPALFFQPQAGLNLVKLALDADFQLPIGTHVDPILATGSSDTLPSTSSSGRVRLGQGYVLLIHDYFAITTGLVRSHFGLGSLANSGNTPEFHSIETSPYGFRQGGDRLWRAQLVVFPLGLVHSDEKTRAPLALLGAADKVYGDDSQHPESDDDTRQWLTGAVVQWSQGSLSSGYIRRTQAHSEGGETNVHIAIFSGQWSENIGADITVKTSGEYAIYVGDSTLSQSVIDPKPMDIFAEGGVGRLGIRWRALHSVLEFGYASGDRNAFDRTQNTFRFDSNHRVGTILYPHLIRTLSAVSAQNINDPNFRSEPPRGYDKVSTQGSVENSIYFNPRLMWAINRHLSLNISWLRAYATTAWTDPYRTSLNGGTPTGPYGKVDSTDLGYEWTVGADFTRSMLMVNMVARAWFTHCVPGPVFQDASDAPPKPLNGGGLMMGVLW